VKYKQYILIAIICIFSISLNTAFAQQTGPVGSITQIYGKVDFNPSERKSKFNILKGTIKSEIKKIENTESSVEFQTRNAVAGVKGTVVYIKANDDFFGVRVGRIYVRGLNAGSKTVYVSGGYYTTLVNGIPIVPRVMTQAMLRQFDDIFDYRRYLPSEVNDVIRKTPFNLKKPKFFK